MKQTWSFQRWRRRYFELKDHRLYCAKEPKVINKSDQSAGIRSGNYFRKLIRGDTVSWCWFQMQTIHVHKEAIHHVSEHDLGPFALCK